MGIKGSLFLSLLLHVSVLVAVMSFIPSYREESDAVRISLNGVNIKEVPRQARVKRSSERKKTPKKRVVKNKNKKRTIVKNVKKKAKRKPQKDVVKKKALKKEIIRRKKVLARSKGDKRKADKVSGKSKPHIESPQRKEVAKSTTTDQVLPVKESASKALHRETRDQIKKSFVDSVKSYQEKYKEENLSVIRETILSYLKYPPIARRMGWEGTVIVRFTLLPDGELEESGIERSSGHGILDRSALEAVRLAHRNFPRPKDRVTIVIPIVYKLE